MREIFVLLLLSSFSIAFSFIFETSGFPSTTPEVFSTWTTTSTNSSTVNTKLPATSSNSSTVNTKLPSTYGTAKETSTASMGNEYKKMLDLLTEETKESVKFEGRLKNLKQNISGVLASLEEKLTNDTKTVQNRIQTVGSRMEEALKHLQQNMSRLSAGLRKTEIKISKNISAMSELIKGRGSELLLKLNNISLVSQMDNFDLLNQTAGFTSGFTVSSAESGLTSTTLKFNKNIFSIGDHYNATTGEFVCEYPGTYVFFLSLYKRGFANSVYCNIRHNGTNVVESYLNPNTQVDYGFYSSGTSTLLQLKRGDIVDVGGCSDVRLLNPLNHRTTLTGFLLQSD